MSDTTNAVEATSSGHRPVCKAKKSTMIKSVVTMKRGFDEKLRHVIFPDNRLIILWDKVILALLILLAFVIPYQVGVSAGKYLLTSMGWLVINVIINACFFVDTFLYFWRAYRRPIDGRLIFNLREIRTHYLWSMFVPNLLGNIPSTLIFYFFARHVHDAESEPCEEYAPYNYLILIKILDILKLGRLLRVGSIIEASDAITEIVERHNLQYLQLFKYAFLIALVSHWFACLWSFVAFIEARTWCRNALLSIPNWIGNWYIGEYGEEGSSDGVLDPLGWTQDTDRYVLSLFWAVQTITSIGYGNVSPLTVAEWWIGSVLQLCAGITWAYVIGGLVGVATALQAKDETYRARIDGANDLIDHFGADILNTDILNITSNKSRTMENKDEKESGSIVAQRIKRYIHHQKYRSPNTTYSSTLEQAFPVLGTLTPELRQVSSLLVARHALERVRYLSSTYLTPKEQSTVTMKCILMQFAAGEIVLMGDGTGAGNFGRGVYVLKRGSAYTYRQFPARSSRDTGILTAGMAFGDDKVLTEDGCKASGGALAFLSFTSLVFIPREAILTALEHNVAAWKECGRWRYLRAIFRDQGLEISD